MCISMAGDRELYGGSEVVKGELSCSMNGKGLYFNEKTTAGNVSNDNNKLSVARCYIYIKPI